MLFKTPIFVVFPLISAFFLYFIFLCLFLDFYFGKEYLLILYNYYKQAIFLAFYFVFFLFFILFFFFNITNFSFFTILYIIFFKFIYFFIFFLVVLRFLLFLLNLRVFSKKTHRYLLKKIIYILNILNKYGQNIFVNIYIFSYKNVFLNDIFLILSILCSLFYAYFVKFFFYDFHETPFFFTLLFLSTFSLLYRTIFSLYIRYFYIFPFYKIEENIFYFWDDNTPNSQQKSDFNSQKSNGSNFQKNENSKPENSKPENSKQTSKFFNFSLINKATHSHSHYHFTPNQKFVQGTFFLHCGAVFISALGLGIITLNHFLDKEKLYQEKRFKDYELYKQGFLTLEYMMQNHKGFNPNHPPISPKQ